MPELPDITVYISALESRIRGTSLKSVKLQSAFLLRTYDIPFDRLINRRVTGLRRIGKRIAIGFEDDYWIVFHLMIAGRLHWRDSGGKPPGKSALIILTFDNGLLFLTEAGTRKKASLYLLHGGKSLALQNPGGVEIDTLDLKTFSHHFTRFNHTVKRVLTDPRIFSGIGNAYSDEILHRARLSPVKQSQKLSPDEMARLFQATRDVLREWTEQLLKQTGTAFPEGVTAFHPEMAVHGKYNEPCPVCQTRIQRIRYADNETDYCPRCQTEGKLLADRALSRLLKKDWPKTITELEENSLPGFRPDPR